MKMFPAASAQIAWNTNDDPPMIDGRIGEVFVFDYSKATELERRRYAKQHGGSHGAAEACWMDEAADPRNTPEGVFGGFLAIGFTHEIAVLYALDQFGQIEEARWARVMAAAMREALRPEIELPTVKLDYLTPPTYERD